MKEIADVDANILSNRKDILAVSNVPKQNRFISSNQVKSGWNEINT